MRTIFRALFAATLALGVVAIATGPATSQASGTRGKVAGIGASRPGIPLNRISADFSRMRNQIGLNAVAIDVWWNYNKDTGRVERGQGTGTDNITSTDIELQAAVAGARGQGLNVYFAPKIWCPKCDLAWRGVIQPADKPGFYASYKSYISEYAAKAQQWGATVFFIGSEMNSMQGDTAEWKQIADTARSGGFTGRLAYEVNWDTMDAVQFWDTVDVVSVSGYFPLSDAERPTVAELKSGWTGSHASAWAGRNWVAAIQSLSQRTGKSVLFGESGYLSSTYAARKPYDESERGNPDMKVQADAYQALLETFENQSFWAGVIWWEWFGVNDPATSMTYTPRDKTAETLLRKWYLEGVRPTSPGQSLSEPATPPVTQPPTTQPLPGGTTNTTEPLPPPNEPATNPPQSGTPYGTPQGSGAPKGEAPPPFQAPKPAALPLTAPVIKGAKETPRPPSTKPPAVTVPVTVAPTTTVAPTPDPSLALPAATPPADPNVIARSAGSTGSTPSRTKAIALGTAAIVLPVMGAGLSLWIRRRRGDVAVLPAVAPGPRRRRHARRRRPRPPAGTTPTRRESVPPRQPAHPIPRGRGVRRPRAGLLQRTRGR